MDQCARCGSLTTVPMPSAELLAGCYRRYASGGYPPKKATARLESRQAEWYRHVLEFFPKPEGIVADIGAGEGWFSQELAARNVRVDSYDYDPPPAACSFVDDRVQWIRADFSRPDWAIRGDYDAVFCISVIEHVIDPRRLMEQLLGITRPGGSVCVFGPCASSWAHRLSGKRWPYIIPGEHLSIPSLKGLDLMAEMLGCRITRKMIPVSYSLKYASDAVLGTKLPRALDFMLRLPTGAFVMTLQRLAPAANCGGDPSRCREGAGG